MEIINKKHLLKNLHLFRNPSQLSVIYGIINIKLIKYSGREYGSASIEIHLKSCKKKWEIEENKKPPKERRPLPEPPKQFDEVVIGAKSG